MVPVKFALLREIDDPSRVVHFGGYVELHDHRPNSHFWAVDDEGVKAISRCCDYEAIDGHGHVVEWPPFCTDNVPDNVVPLPVGPDQVRERLTGNFGEPLVETIMAFLFPEQRAS